MEAYKLFRLQDLNKAHSAKILFIAFIHLTLFPFQLKAGNIINFTGAINHSAVYFQWELTPNLQYQLLEVERSLDSVNFTTCLSFGNNNDRLFAWDKRPVAGKSYYRLKLTQSNGTTELSQVVGIHIPKMYPSTDLISFPRNIIKENVKTISADDHYTILVTDWNGNIQLIKQVTHEEDISYAKILSDLRPGIHYLLFHIFNDMVILKQSYSKHE